MFQVTFFAELCILESHSIFITYQQNLRRVRVDLDDLLRHLNLFDIQC